MDTRDLRSIFSMIVIGITGFFITGCASIPQFEIEPRYKEVLENTSLGAELFILRANDNDSTNTITFKANSAQTNEYVNITQLDISNHAKANITLRKTLDRELQEGGIELKFSLTDTRGNTLYKDVNLYILDVCDEIPQFDMPSYTFYINETNMNVTNNTLPVYSKIHATDKDNGAYAIVVYYMEPKTESSYWREKYNKTFSMDPQNGQVHLLQDLDYEENSFYQFTLYAQDNCNPNKTSADLTIKVQDVQDQPPFFIGLPYMGSIQEGNYSDHALLQVSAFDGDRGVPNNVKYFINRKTGCSNDHNSTACNFCYNLFEIDNSTGKITVSGYLDWALLDVQRVFGTCTIIVEAKEDESHYTNQSEQTVSNTTVTLTIVDTNNHAPQFANKSYTARIQENAVKNTPLVLDGDVTGISVSDYDQGINSTFSVTLTCGSSSDCDTFEVVPSTAIVKEGVITIRVNNSLHLDYETRKNITITVIATEQMNTSHTDTATVIVQIYNENEFAPVFHNETYEVWIKEGSANGTNVKTITATDEDRNGSDELSYSLSGGNKLFSVDNKTGEVVTNCAPDDLDREKLDKIYLSLTATDEGRRMNQTQLIVNLLDVNDKAPEFQTDRYTAILDENSTTFVNESFLTVQATDRDDPETNNSKVLYEFRNITNLERNFIIDSEKGEMRLVSPLDYEALNYTLQGVINLTIFAYNDHKDQKMVGNVTVTIFVQDVNDNAPQFSQIMYYGRIKENAKTGATVAEINATDADKTDKNREIIFAIEPRSVDFQINSSTGIVSVGAGADFDRDRISSYGLIIIAIDHGAYPYTSTTTLNVTIEDVNNKPPTFNQKSFIVEVREDVAVGSLVMTCDAKDPDENASLSYNITAYKGLNKTGQSFEETFIQSYIGILKKNGTLYVMSPLDRETVEKLEMTIFVNDTGAEGNTPQNATATVTITVLDVDDSPPKFKGGSDLKVGMRRTMELDKEIFELKSYVTDEDSPQNAINKWVFKTFIFKMTTDLENKLSGKKRGHRCDDPICVTGNGTIVNNMYYTQDMSGFFNVTVLVKDDAGNDTAYILIFLIADSQVLKMTLYGIRTNVAMIKDVILSDCSNVTGLLFVYDSIADHKADDGTVDTLKTDLFFHIQDRKNNKVLSAEEAKRLLDEYADKLYYARMKHNIVSIESSLKSENPENESSKTIYVMAAVIGLLALVVLIVGYMFFCSSNRYKRKLRAAMPSDKEMSIKKKDDFVVPGSNMYAHKDNPLLNTPYAPPEYEEIDATSQNSLDKNDVDDANISQRDELEEREVTLDMYGEDYYTQMTSDDPLDAALREHDAQKQASMHKLGDLRVGHSKNEDDEETMVNGFVNNGFHHNLELETSEI